MLKIMKTNIFNKVKKATRGMSNLLLIPLLPLLLGSCVDTVILPDDKTVDEDFWKSKSDVQLMVNGQLFGLQIYILNSKADKLRDSESSIEEDIDPVIVS